MSPLSNSHATLNNYLTLNILHHTTPHKLCNCEVKDVHSLQSFVSTHSEESDSLLFIHCLQQQMLLTSTFSKGNSAISLEEWVLVIKVSTTATRKLRVNMCPKYPAAHRCFWIHWEPFERMIEEDLAVSIQFTTTTTITQEGAVLDLKLYSLLINSSMPDHTESKQETWTTSHTDMVPRDTQLLSVMGLKPLYFICCLEPLINKPISICCLSCELRVEK